MMRWWWPEGDLNPRYLAPQASALTGGLGDLKNPIQAGLSGLRVLEFKCNSYKNSEFT